MIKNYNLPPISSFVQCQDRILDLRIPRVMGILNVTPDSFSDGGRYLSKQAAITRALTMVEEGAALIDIGGESSRPFATPVSIQEELDRVIPVVQAVVAECDTIVSVDTTKPEVMREAIAVGARFINDINALCSKGALEVIANTKVGVCLMHMQGEPANMQTNPFYKNVVAEVKQFLADRIMKCLESGIAREHIVIDPGFCFGKNKNHNLQLLKEFNSLLQLGQPLLMGLSSKSLIGEILNCPINQRMIGSLTAHIIAVCNGASIIRTHDVKPTVEAITVVSSLLAQEVENE